MCTHKLLIQRGSLGIQILPNLLTKFSFCHHFRSPFKKAWWKYSRNFHSSLTHHTPDWLNVARNIRGLQSDVHREKRISDRVYFLYQYYFMDVWKVIGEMSLTIYKNSFVSGTEWIFLAPLTKWCILSQDTSEKKKSNHVETALIEKHKLDHSKDFSHPITSGRRNCFRLRFIRDVTKSGNGKWGMSVVKSFHANIDFLDLLWL